MNPTFLIARKDLRTYFSSPIAYIIVGAFLFIEGWMFGNIFSGFVVRTYQMMGRGFGQTPTLTESVLRPLFGNMNVVLLFVAPFITMRLLAEERRDHTIELLLTAPLRAYQIVLGKFLAGFGLVVIIICATLFYPLTMQTLAHPDWGVIWSSYLGTLLLASTYVAVGLFWSALTENQVVAAVLSFGTLLFLWLISWAAQQAGPVWSDVLTHLSLIGHFSNFAMGVIDSSDVIYYLSFTGFALFLTNLAVEAN